MMSKDPSPKSVRTNLLRGLLAAAILAAPLAVDAGVCPKCGPGKGRAFISRNGFTIDDAGDIDERNAYAVACQIDGTTVIDYAMGSQLYLGATACDCLDFHADCPDTCSSELESQLATLSPLCPTGCSDGLDALQASYGTNGIRIYFHLEWFADSVTDGRIHLRFAGDGLVPIEESIPLPPGTMLDLPIDGFQPGIYGVEATVSTEVCLPTRPDLKIGETENYRLLVNESPTGVIPTLEPMFP